MSFSLSHLEHQEDVLGDLGALLVPELVHLVGDLDPQRTLLKEDDREDGCRGDGDAHDAESDDLGPERHDYSLL